MKNFPRFFPDPKEDPRFRPHNCLLYHIFRSLVKCALLRADKCAQQAYIPFLSHSKDHSSAGPVRRSDRSETVILREACKASPTEDGRSPPCSCRGGFVSLPARSDTRSAGPVHRSDHSETVMLKERIDPFPTGMYDDRPPIVGAVHRYIMV